MTALIDPFEAPAPLRTVNAAERTVLLSPRAIPGSLFSFEALLVLYMFVGLYKADPRFDWIPVDPTGLFFALSVVVGSFIIVRNPIPKGACPVILAMLALVAWWAVTLIWSPSKVYGPSKVFYLGTLVLWGVTAAALIIGPNPERVQRLFTLILLLAIWVGIEALWIYRDNPSGLFVSRASGDYRPLGDYQHIGRITGLGALVAFVAWLFGRRTSAVRPLFLALFAGLAFVVTIAGGKGPVLQTALGILLPLLLGLQVTRRKILYKRYQISIIWLVVALIAGMTVYIGVTDQVPKSLERLAGMIEAGELQGTAAGRASNYADAFEFWGDAPLLGHGAGSWTILEHGLDERDPPHNMFLEFGVESGVVGLVLMLALLVVALRPISVERLRNDPLSSCAFLLFVNAFISAMLAGDVAENRIMFMLLGVLTVFRVSKGAPSRGAPSRALEHGPALSLARQPKENRGTAVVRQRLGV